MSSSTSADFWRERLEKDANPCGEDYYYDSLMFCQRHIGLVFDESRMEPARQEKGPRNAGLDTICVRMSQWYSEPICGGNDSQPSSFKRMNEGSPGAKRPPYQIPRPVAKDEGRRARKKGDVPPPLLRRIVSPRILEDAATMEFYANTDKIHYATSEDAYARYYSQSIFPQSVKKTGGNVEQFHMSTYQCSILFNNMGSFSRKSDLRKSQNMGNPVAKHEKYNVTNLSLLRGFWGNNDAHVILTAEADSLPTDARKLLEDHGLVGCHSARGNYLSAHARIDSTGHVRLLWESNDEEDRRSDAATFEVKLGQRSEGPCTDSRERTADTLSSDLENVAEVLEENTTKRILKPTTDCL